MGCQQPDTVNYMASTPLMSTVPDQDLVRMYVHTRDNYYFTQLYKRHQKQVFRICMTYTGKSEDSEDYMQEIFLRIIQKLNGYRGEALFTTWIRSIATNYCLDQLRRQKRQRAQGHNYEIDLFYEPTWGLSPDEARKSTYERILNQLPVRQRELLYSKYGTGSSIDEIARHQGITPSAVKMRIKRAKDLAGNLYMNLKLKEGLT